MEAAQKKKQPISHQIKDGNSNRDKKKPNIQGDAAL